MLRSGKGQWARKMLKCRCLAVSGASAWPVELREVGKVGEVGRGIVSAWSEEVREVGKVGEENKLIASARQWEER